MIQISYKGAFFPIQKVFCFSADLSYEATSNLKKKLLGLLRC